MSLRGVSADPWCEPDGCPSSICNGPHVAHHCPNGDLVVQRLGQQCPFCAYEDAAAQP